MFSCEHMQILISVAECGNFSAASRTLNMPTTTLSRKIAELEQQLGVKLFNRNTRKMSLTSEGLFLLDQSRPLLHEMEELMRTISQRNLEPQGILRVTAPYYDVCDLTSKLNQFQNQYPKVELQVLLTNEYLDLVARGIDLAIRLGPLADSSLVARQIGDAAYQCVASSKLVPALRKILRPEHLQEVACIGLAPQMGPVSWHFDRDGQEYTYTFRPKLVVNDPHFGLHACLAGVGAAYLPSRIVQKYLRRGDLVHVLPGFEARSRKIYAVFHHRRLHSPALAMLVDYLSNNPAPSQEDTEDQVI